MTNWFLTAPGTAGELPIPRERLVPCSPVSGIAECPVSEETLHITQCEFSVTGPLQGSRIEIHI